MSNKSETADDILGRRIDLSDGRIVFVGISAKHPDRRFIAFKSDDGHDTKLVLSVEAANAFGLLLTDPMAGMPLGTFPHRVEWHVVKEGLQRP